MPPMRADAFLARPRLVAVLALLLTAAGVLAWLDMPRQEDPTLPYRAGVVVVPVPGADAAAVERLVLRRVEDRLAEVDGVKHLTGTARTGVAIVRIDLLDRVQRVQPVWDEIRRALAEVRAELPAAAGEPLLDDRTYDVQAGLIALTGGDPLRLRRAARSLQRELQGVPGTRRVVLSGDPGEQVTVRLDESAAAQLGLDAATLARLLAGRNQGLPAGTLAAGGRTLALRPGDEFTSIDELAATAIPLPDGRTVELRQVAQVAEEPARPADELARLGGAPAVTLGAIPADGIDVVDWGRRLRARLDQLRPGLAPLQAVELAWQPRQVDERLRQLGVALAEAVLYVAAVMVLSMGLRLGTVVAAVVPVVVCAGLALYAAGGGVLHQISIAALVIALGLLVDDAVVMAEGIQARLDRGEGRDQAVRGAVAALAMPLLAATGTTMAAFVPMLLAGGVAADFTRALPIVLLLTLALSYLAAMALTPLMAGRLLRARGGHGGDHLLARLGRRLGGFAAERPWTVATTAALAVAAALALWPLVPQRYFPAADRAVVLVDLRLPEGTHLDATAAASAAVESALAARSEVALVAAWAGRGAPHFYYALEDLPASPQVAQVVAVLRERRQLDAMLAWARATLPAAVPAATVTVRQLEQGPPLAAPVEVRVFHPDGARLAEAVAAVRTRLRAIPGAISVREDAGGGAAVLRLAVDDAAAARAGLDRSGVAQALLARTRGLPAGSFRGGDDPLPIRVVAGAGEQEAGEGVGGWRLAGATPLGAVAVATPDWVPAVIHHRDRRRTGSVLADPAPGSSPDAIVAAFAAAPPALPAGTTWELGGEAEGQAESNGGMVAALPIGLLVLVGFLLWEFDSVRRVLIILVTVPLAACGVVPGLLVGGQPFGFMALLGVMSLAGIVVKNAIVLVDLADRRLEAGDGIDAALAAAVGERIRPILLTTACTVLGLVPLAFSPGTLWPPLAWTVIIGLCASTLLTLAVVPALYRLLIRR